MIKRIISILLSILSISVMFTFSGCKSGKEMVYGDIVYGYINDLGDLRLQISGDYIIITGLSYKGEKKETIFIPDKIDGKKVIGIGEMSGLGFKYTIAYGSWKWCYLPKYLRTSETIYFGWQIDKNPEINEKKLLMMDCDKLGFLHNTEQYIYVSKELYDKYKSEYQDFDLNQLVVVADLEFISDGEVYLIADYEIGEKIAYMPQPPEKQGYEFEGWYKEPECINEWNFEEDIFSLDEGITIMKLYAKWHNK